MKKEYVAPTMVCEEFAANEYVAACGDSGVVYKFKCNAGSRSSKYNVYLADGSPYCTSGLDFGNKNIRGWDYYHPCYDADSQQGYHEADSDTGFVKGYMYKQDRYGNNTGSKIDVIIWTENYTNCHCTTDLDMNSWETAKS